MRHKIREQYAKEFCFLKLLPVISLTELCVFMILNLSPVGVACAEFQEKSHVSISISFLTNTKGAQ